MHLKFLITLLSDEITDLIEIIAQALLRISFIYYNQHYDRYINPFNMRPIIDLHNIVVPMTSISSDMPFSHTKSL